MNSEDRKKFNSYMANRRRSRRTVKQDWYWLHGGPWHGQKVLLSDNNSPTLTFRVTDWKGQYVPAGPGAMEWTSK